MKRRNFFKGLLACIVGKPVLAKEVKPEPPNLDEQLAQVFRDLKYVSNEDLDEFAHKIRK